MVNIFIKLKSHITSLICLVVLTLFTWRNIIHQSFTGEGAFYFTYGYIHQYIRFPKALLDNDKGARIYFDVLKVFFKDNIDAYFILLLILSIIIFILFYFMCYVFTHKINIAFIATCFFAINYNAMFEMLGIGRYDFFVERMINAILLFPSFLFFKVFIDSKKKKYYLISFLLYFTSVFLAHFSIFYLPFIVLYSIILAFNARRNKKKRFYFIKIITPYIIISSVMLLLDALFGYSHVGKDTFPKTISVIPALLIEVVHQLTLLTIPGSLIKFLFDAFTITVPKLYIPITLFYILVIFLIVKLKDKELKYFAMCMFITAISICFLNLFMRWGQVVNMKVPYRYLFAPSIPLSLFWGISLYLLLIQKRNFLKKIIFFIVIIGWIGINSYTIRLNINRNLYLHSARKEIAHYIKTLSTKFKEDSLVLIPSFFSYQSADFLNIFYGKKNTKFLPINTSKYYLPRRPFDPKKDFMIDYNFDEGKVVNDTKNYNKNLFMQ